MTIPVHHRYGVAGFDPQPCQTTGEPADPLPQLTVGLAPEVTVDNLLLGKLPDRITEQVFDQQGIRISGWRAVDGLGGHGDAP